MHEVGFSPHLTSRAEYVSTSSPPLDSFPLLFASPTVISVLRYVEPLPTGAEEHVGLELPPHPRRPSLPLACLFPVGSGHKARSTLSLLLVRGSPFN